MSIRAVVVAHPEALAAEGIAAALGRYPALVTVGVATTVGELERCAERADVAAVDSRIPGAAGAVARLLKRGVRVVVMGGAPSGGDDERRCVPLGAPVSVLAQALAPGAVLRAVRVSSLSGREHQVLRMTATGMAGKQIGRALGISPKTVEQHKTRIYRKLGVPNQAAAVAALAGGGHD